MKAKHLKRLRKKVGSLQTFTIRETCSLFGDFFGSNRLCLVMSDSKVKAGNPIRAIEVYMKKYRNQMKKKNEYEREEYTETTQNWGHLMVTDEKGFMRFY